MELRMAGNMRFHEYSITSVKSHERSQHLGRCHLCYAVAIHLS